jgi:hypothetical protein
MSIASSNGTQTIRLSGVGGSGVNVAGFTAPSKTDVLLVLDNSCSMTDKQQGIVANPGALFGFAFDAGVDFHFGITTTVDMFTLAGALVMGLLVANVVVPPRKIL